MVTDNYLYMKEILSQIIHDHMEIIQYQHLIIHLLFIYLFIQCITSVQFLCVQLKLVT